LRQDAADTARLPHVPGLNGLRGLAVAAVLLFHAGLTWIPGGQFGVTVFFTMSGFLITALLLLEKHRTGAIALRAFWGRRARRLVPAMLICFGLVAVVVRLAAAPASDGIGWDAVAAATWTANWRFVLHHQVYADLFSLPSPFQHFWSLAVEEQFYVFFPLLAVVVLGRRRAQLRTGRLAVLLGALVAASTWQAARLHDAGEGLGHAYYGTDARMAEILVGSLLALALVRPDGLRAIRGLGRAGLDLLALGGLAVIGVACATVGTESASLYRGWLLAVAVSTAAVVAATMQPGSWTGKVLALRPLVGLGVISYGVYLFHWPLFLLLTESSTGYSGSALFTLRIGSTLALATLSYLVVEAPIRAGRLRTAESLVTWGAGATAGIAAVVLAGGILVPPVPEPATITTTSAAAAPSPSATAAQQAAASTRPTAPRNNKVGVSAQGPSRPVGAPRNPPPQVVPVPKTRAASRPKSRPKSKSVPKELTQDPNDFPVPPMPAARPGALKVVVVGDSVGHNLGDAMHTWADQRTDVVAYNLSIPACPLSKGRERRVGTSVDKRFDVQPICEWQDDPTSRWYKAFQEFDADVVVTEDGINETWDRKLPSWDDWRSPEDPRFDTWLTGEYQTVVDRWRGEGRVVLMINTPCADWGRFENFKEMSNPDARVNALNSLVQPGVTGTSVLDLFGRVCPGGKYSDDVEGIPNGRSDGIHFTNEAALALVTNWLGPTVLQRARAGS
jgi:peptidoglycan/LPS O-acetylase OafA/YrhL